MGYQGITSSQIEGIDHATTGMTKHAGIRVQQRGVNLELLDRLLAYGRHEPDHKGCHVVTFDGKALEVVDDNYLGRLTTTMLAG